MSKLGFAEGDLIDVETALDHAHPDRIVRGLTVVRYALPDGCCGAYYPETQPLFALEHIDRDSLTPSYKSVPVRLRRAEAGGMMDSAVVREGVVGRGAGGPHGELSARTDAPPLSPVSQRDVLR